MYIFSFLNQNYFLSGVTIVCYLNRIRIASVQVSYEKDQYTCQRQQQRVHAWYFLAAEKHK